MLIKKFFDSRPGLLRRDGRRYLRLHVDGEELRCKIGGDGCAEGFRGRYGDCGLGQGSERRCLGDDPRRGDDRSNVREQFEGARLCIGIFSSADNSQIRKNWHLGLNRNALRET